VEEAKRYHLDIVGVSSTNWNCESGWQLFYSGADPNASAQAASVCRDTHEPPVGGLVSDWVPMGSRACILMFKVKYLSIR